MVEQGKRLEARALLVEICRADGQDVKAWLALAELNHVIGAYADCERCCGHVLATDNNHHRALLLRGLACEATGRIEESVASFLACAKIAPKDAEIWYFLGNALRKSGHLDRATEAYRRAIELRPSYLEALNNLAATLREQGRLIDSLKFLEQAGHLAKDSPQLLHNTALARMALSQPEAAIELLVKATRLAPGDSNGHQLLANAYFVSYRFDDALASFERAILLQPTNWHAIAGKATVYERRGEIEQAYKLISPLLRGEDTPPGVALVFCTLAPYLDLRDQAGELLRGLLERGRVDPKLTTDCHFELGKLADESGRYDAAFQHYRVANETQQRFSGDIMATSGGSDTDMIETVLKHCGVDFWADLAYRGNDTRRPVFVVGMPRSGTTLVEQILASHPAVRGAGELQDLRNIAGSLAETEGQDILYPHCLAKVDETRLSSLADDYLRKLDEVGKNADRVVDKLPHNFLHLGLISVLFPNARIIHTMRDPRDTCLSIYFTKFNARTPYATDLRKLGRYFRRYEELMAHWRLVLEIPILDVQYEQLVADTESESKRLIDFCGLDWDARCLSFYRTRRDVDTPSYRQVREPIYRRSVGRWQNYESHLSPLLEELRL